MDPTRDNPILRFNTFWWALWTLLIFAALLAALLIFQHQPPVRLEDAAAVARYATKDRILKAEAAALTRAEIAAAIPKVAAELPSSKPTAVEKPEQVVPGSPTALKLAAEPAGVPGPNETAAPADVAAPVEAPATAEPSASTVDNQKLAALTQTAGPETKPAPAHPPAAAPAPKASEAELKKADEKLASLLGKPKK